MKNIISAKTAGIIMIVLLSALMVFHVLVLVGIIPYDIVWSGQIDDTTSLFLFEGLAFVVTALFAVIVALKIGMIPSDRFKTAVSIGIWFMFVFFFLNTIGNLSSGVSAEKLIFTPFAFILTVLAFRLGIERGMHR